MRVCGVELKGNEAVICLLSLDNGLFTIPPCRSRKLDIADANDTEQLRRFQFSFAKLMEDYKVDQVVIRTRPTKGKFAGGYVGFKLEATIQLLENLQVSLISNTQVKEALKNNELAIEFNDTGLKKFQEQAFYTAFAFLSQSS